MITKNNAQSLFQAIVLMAIAFTIFSAISVFILFGVRYTVLMNVIGALISYGFYRISFTPHYKQAIHGYIVISILFQFVLMFITPTIETTILILIPIFFAHLFYDSRRMLLISVLSLILLNMYALTYVYQLNPFLHTDLFIRDVFTIGVIGMLFVSTLIRNQNEWELMAKSAALEESEAHFQHVVNNSVMGMGLFDVKTGRITILSQNKLRGYNTSNFTSVSDWLSIILPEDHQTIFDTYERISNAPINQVERMEFRIQKPGSRLQIVECYLSGLQNTSSGKPKTVLISAHLVTKQRLAEQNRLALAVQQQKVELMNDVVIAFSHEFRTPLSSIELSLHLLQRQLVTPQTSTYVDRARSQIARLDRLINQLNFMIRLEQNTVLNNEVINIASMVKQVVAVSKESEDASGLHITLLGADDVVKMMGDSDLLTRVFHQLLDNAIKYTPKDGNISVSLDLLENGVMISVKDNGSGIAEDEQPKLFERFARADNHHNKEGLGLGLFIVKKIVEAHAGTVTLHSTEGQGTEVSVTLPTFLADDPENQQ